jgi:rRNA maturation protein Nop10
MREIKNPRHVVLKNMRYTIQGVCPWCGGKLSRFVKSRDKKEKRK